MRYLFLVVLLISLACCGQKKTEVYHRLTAEMEPVETGETEQGLRKAYFASGCFWCSESVYESVMGVEEVISGYAGGTGADPVYEDYERKGHAETVEVIYNPRYVDFETLLDVYFASQNVTQQNGQGPDLGSGYRSVIFYQNQEEKALIEQKIEEVQRFYKEPVAAEVIPFQKFWRAEEYHQNFEEKHPNHPYIQNVSLPRLYRFQNRNPDLLKPQDQ